MVEASSQDIKTILPCLRSNNISFEIFSFVEGVKAFTLFRALCKKSEEKLKVFVGFMEDIELKG
jgi:hypothetical protein